MQRFVCRTLRNARGIHIRQHVTALPSNSASSLPVGPPLPNGTPLGMAMEKQHITVHFFDPNAAGLPRRYSVRAKVGSTLVDVAKEVGLDIPAACGLKLVVLAYRPLWHANSAMDDMLNSAFTLTPTSRLGCQVRLTREMDGIECTLPDHGARSSVRKMEGTPKVPLDMPRPRITKQWTAVPAVPLPHSRSIIKATGPLNPEAEGSSLEKIRLESQANLIEGLESELRQLRAKYGDDGRGSNAIEKVKEAAKKAKGEKQTEGEDKDDLEKLKAELQRTRVDFSKMRRRVGFEDVIGLDAAKRALREAVIWPAVADASLFSGIRSSPGGLLLYGPPGCGKTMIARAAASELSEQAAFFHVRPADVMSKFYGDSQQRILALEELVAEASPAVVFFDEVDSLLGGRDGSNVAEHHRSTTNALLAWMDGFGAGSEQVFFLGATNRAEAIDEAALRRFGEAVEVEAPCHEARLALLRHLCTDKAAADGHLVEMSVEDLNTVAERTDGYSLADVDRLVRRAFLHVMRELPDGIRPGLLPSDVPPVRLQHFDSALQESTGTSALRQMLKARGKTRAEL